jgi:hypothetical protein
MKRTARLRGSYIAAGCAFRVRVERSRPTGGIAKNAAGELARTRIVTHLDSANSPEVVCFEGLIRSRYSHVKMEGTSLNHNRRH